LVFAKYCRYAYLALFNELLNEIIFEGIVRLALALCGDFFLDVFAELFRACEWANLCGEFIINLRKFNGVYFFNSRFKYNLLTSELFGMVVFREC